MGVSRRDILRSGAALVAGIACERSLHGEAHADFSEPKDESWAVENDLIRRDVGFRPGVGLYTTQLSDKSAKIELSLPARDVAKARPEFSFNCDGKSCASNDGSFDLLAASPTSTGTRSSLSVRMKHKNIPLEVTALYSIYTGHAASRKSLLLKNTGSAPLKITHLSVEALEFALGPENEMTLWAQ